MTRLIDETFAGHRAATSGVLLAFWWADGETDRWLALCDLNALAAVFRAAVVVNNNGGQILSLLYGMPKGILSDAQKPSIWHAATRYSS